MATLAPTTKLQAVNVLLSTINEAPINSLLNLSNVHAAVAVEMLDEVSRAIQSRGWHWNRDDDYTLALDANSKIPVPINTLSVDSYGNDAYRDVALRGQYLYDRKNHTYIFDSSIKVTITFLFDWDELPEPARRYITMRAARMFQNRVLGSEALNQFNSRDELTALAYLEDEEARVSGRNLLYSRNDDISVMLRR